MKIRPEFKNIEDLVKLYYSQKHQIKCYYTKIGLLENQIINLNQDLHNNNFNLNADLASPQVNNEIKSKRVVSLDDRLIKAYNELENEIKRKQCDLLEYKVKIMKVEESISLIGSFINGLTDEEKRILETIYRDKKKWGKYFNRA